MESPGVSRWPAELDLLDLTLGSPAENLALDEALLVTADELGGNGCLRLWESPQYAVVLGRSCRVADDVRLENCRAEGIPVLRRSSGGGTVLLGPGCLVYSLILPQPADGRPPDLSTVTAAILERIADALNGLAPGILMQGTSDLTIPRPEPHAGSREPFSPPVSEGISRTHSDDTRKFSGNSQRWLRRTLLHHGTLLYDFALDKIARCLALPKLQPEYRAGRSHADFLFNLPVSADALRAGLTAAWNAHGRRSVPPYHRAAELVRTKYACDAWNFER